MFADNNANHILIDGCSVEFVKSFCYFGCIIQISCLFFLGLTSIFIVETNLTIGPYRPMILGVFSRYFINFYVRSIYILTRWQQTLFCLTREFSWLARLDKNNFHKLLFYEGHDIRTDISKSSFLFTLIQNMYTLWGVCMAPSTFYMHSD